MEKEYVLHILSVCVRVCVSVAVVIWHAMHLRPYCRLSDSTIQDVPGGNVNIVGGHSIGHSKQKCLYEHVSYS